MTRARDGGEARDALMREPFDALVTDFQMPVLTGLDLLVLVRSQPNPIPVIIVSGTWTPEEKQKARDLGPDGVYEKGALNLMGLVQELDRILKQ